MVGCTYSISWLSLLTILFVSGVQVISCSQGGSSCSNQQCNCEVNNGDVLQTLIESKMNQSLNERLSALVEETVENKFQDIKMQVNASIDEKIVNSQHDTPGKELKTVRYMRNNIIPAL